MIGLRLFLGALNGCPCCDDPFVCYPYILTDVAAGTKVMVQYVKISPLPGGEEERTELAHDNAFFNVIQKKLWDWRMSLQK